MTRLQDATVVITGASSGIGRATAERFAAAGARMVLAARGVEKLESAAGMCRRFGGPVQAVPTDVTDPAAMAALAARAAELGGGRIDVWVNNAGTGAVGAFDETPVEAHRQVLQVNLAGYLYGAHAVLPYFKRQRTGTLVNVLSLGAWAPTPYAVSYTASKYGLRGYSEALRAELRSWPGIHVCDIFPSVVDTPGFAHGGNYTGRALRPPHPRYDARLVAQAIHDAVVEGRSSSTAVGAVARLARAGNLLAPALLRYAMALSFEAYFRRAEVAPRTDGALFAPLPGEPGSIDGGWRKPGSARDLGLLAGAGFIGLMLLKKLRG